MDRERNKGGKRNGESETKERKALRIHVDIVRDIDYLLYRVVSALGVGFHVVV